MDAFIKAGKTLSAMKHLNSPVGEKEVDKLIKKLKTGKIEFQKVLLPAEIVSPQRAYPIGMVSEHKGVKRPNNIEKLDMEINDLRR